MEAVPLSFFSLIDYYDDFHDHNSLIIIIIHHYDLAVGDREAVPEPQQQTWTCLCRWWIYSRQQCENYFERRL